MKLFLILAAPCWYYLIISFFQLPSRRWRGILTPWFAGIFVGMICLLLTLGLYTRIPFKLDLTQIYMWGWIRGIGWPLLVGSIIVSVIYFFFGSNYIKIRELAGWLSGIASVYLIWQALALDSGANIYRLFYLPIFWISAMGIMIIILDFGLRILTIKRFIFIGIALIVPFILSFLIVLYFFGYKLLAWFIVILLLVLSHIIIFLVSRGWFK